MPLTSIFERIRQLFAPRKATLAKNVRTLRLVQLEDRRMLNGAIAMTGINLTGTETLTVSEGGNVDVGGGIPVQTVNLTLTDGTWTGIDPGLNGGLYELDGTGKTLTVDASVLADGGFAVDAGNVLHIQGDDLNSQHLNIDLTNVSAGDSYMPSNGIAFDGGDLLLGGDNDTLSVTGYTASTVDTLTLTHTGLESGTVDLGGIGEITYSHIEPLALGGTAANLIINLPAGADSVVISDVGGNDGFSTITGTTFEATTFMNPTSSLTIRDGTGIKSISVQGLDNAFDADVSLIDDDGVDDNPVSFDVNDTDLGTGNLLVEAGQITLNRLISTTGDVTLQSTTSITDGNAGLNITAHSAILSAVDGIGSGDAIETNVDILDAHNLTSGSIEIAETNAIDVLRILQDRDGNISLIAGGTVDVLAAGTGVVIDDIDTSDGSADILLRSTSSGVLINQIVRNDNSNAKANITLDAIGQNSDVSVVAAVTTAAGDITIQADDSVLFGAAGDVTANGAGIVQVDANRVNTVGDNGDQILMADGTVINGGTGTVTLTALGTNSGDITLGSLQTANITAAAVVVTTTSGNILDGGDLDTDIVTTGASSGVTLTATNGSVGGTSTNVFKSTFNPIDVNLAHDLTVMAPAGAVAISGPALGTQTITAITLYMESNADMDVSTTDFSGFQNVALITTGKLKIADTGLAVDGDLRIEANDVDATTAGNPVILGSTTPTTRINNLLYHVNGAADERVVVFADNLDVWTNSYVQVEANGNTRLKDLDCDLTSFNTNSNTAVIVAIAGTLTQGAAVGITPITEANDKILSQNLLLLGDGTICLDHPDNDVTTVAGQMTGTASLYYNDVNALTIGTVSSLYIVPAPAFPAQAYNGLQSADGALHAQAGGNLTVNQAVLAGSAGNVLLASTDVANDVIVNAAVSSTTGHVTINAGHDITLNATVTTGGNGTVAFLAGNDISLNAAVTTINGDILVRAMNSISQSMLISTTNGDAGLVATTGNITQTATGDITTTNGDVLIDVGNNWTMANGTVITVGGQDFVGRAAGTITLGQISMTNATANHVALQAVAGNISDINGATVNIEETVMAATTSVSLRAGGIIGAGDAGNGTPPINDNAIDLNVDTVAASSATGIYLREIAAGGNISVGNVAATTVNVDFQRIDFKAAGAADNVNRTLLALNGTATSGNGPVKLVAETGTITVNNAVTANGSGDILLEARGAASDVIVDAGITSGTGYITLNAGNDINLNASLTTGGAGSVFLLATNGTADVANSISIGGAITSSSGDILIQTPGNISQTAAIINSSGNVGIISTNGSVVQTGTGDITTANGDVLVNAANDWTMASGTQISVGGQDLVGIAGGSIALGQILMTNLAVNRVALQAVTGTIADANGATVNVTETVATATTSVSLRAAGMIGAADAANGTPTVNANAIDLNVDFVAAVASTGIYLREIAAGGAITVNDVPAVTVTVDGVEQVNFNSTRTPVAAAISTLATLEDLTTGLPGGPMKLIAENGTIAVEGGTATPTVGVVAGSAGDILLEARGASSDVIINASVSSGTGHVTLDSGRDIDLNATVTTGGSGTVFILAGRTAHVDAIVTTADGDILIRATENISQTALIATTNSNVGLITTNGNITQTAAADVTSTNGDVLVDAGNNWTMANGTTITVGGQDFVGRAIGTISLGLISMTNATANHIAIQTISGNITDINGAAVNIEETVFAAATSVSLRSGGMIGAADAGNGIPSVNANAIDLNVDLVAASAGTGIYLREIAAGGAITVRDVAAVTVTVAGAEQVNFNSTRSPVSATRTLEVLEDLRTGPAGGPIKLVAENGTIAIEGGTATPTEGVVAANTGDVLLDARGAASDIIVNAIVASNNGHITLISGDEINMHANLSAGGAGTVYLLATNATHDTVNGISMQSGTTIVTGGGNVRMIADNEGDIQLGLINTGNGSVSLIAEGSILDNNAAAINVQANALQMVADAAVSNASNQAGIIGDSNPGEAIDTQVTTLAARSADGIYVREADGLTVDFTGDITIQQVNFNSTVTAVTDATLSDLTTTDNSPIKIQSATGALILNEGDADNQAVSANGSGDVLLQTLATSGDITTNARILSGTGNITLNAGDDIAQNADIVTSGTGTIYLRAENATMAGTINGIDMQSGTSAVTGGGNVRMVADNEGDIRLGFVDAGSGNVSLIAEGSILDNNGTALNVQAVALRMVADAAVTNTSNLVGIIGASDLSNPNPANNVNAIETHVTTLAAQSAEGIYIRELNGVTVDFTGDISIQQVIFDSTSTAQTDLSLSDLTTIAAGSKIEVFVEQNGLTINAGTIGTHGVDAGGNSSQVYLEAAGDVLINADVIAGPQFQPDFGEQIHIRSIAGNIVLSTGVLISTDQNTAPNQSSTSTSDNIEIAAGATLIRTNAASGATQIDVVSVAGLAVGDAINISDGNSATQMVTITAISGTTLTLSDPLSSDFTIAQNASVTRPVFAALDADAAMGQNQIHVANAAGFFVGDIVVVDDGNSAPQSVTIAAVTGNTLTLSAPLASHLAVTQHATVRHAGFGEVRIGTDVVVRTDGGVATHFYDRVGQHLTGTSLFVWDGTAVPATVTRVPGTNDYILTFNVTIGVAGSDAEHTEDNLRLDVDWRDPTDSRIESLYLTQGPHIISHTYSGDDFNAFLIGNNPVFLTDFSVSQHESIQVLGGALTQDGITATKSDGPLSTTDLYTSNPVTHGPFPPGNTLGTGNPMLVVSDTDSNSDYHFEDGLVEIRLPTLFLPAIIPDPEPPALPAPLVAVAPVFVAPFILVTPVEVAETPFSSYSTQSSDYFQLREFDGVTRKVVEHYEHIRDDFGELLLQPARLKQWVADEHFQDRIGLELWLITEKHTKNGPVTVERPVLKFDIANGQPFPAKEIMPSEFEELKLNPMPLDENFNNPTSDNPGASENGDANQSSRSGATSQESGDIRPDADLQSRCLPPNVENGAPATTDELHAAFTSTASRSMLTTIAVAAVLKQPRADSIVPSKSRQLLNRILDRQRGSDNP